MPSQPPKPLHLPQTRHPTAAVTRSLGSQARAATSPARTDPRHGTPVNGPLSPDPGTRRTRPPSPRDPPRDPPGRQGVLPPASLPLAPPGDQHKHPNQGPQGPGGPTSATSQNPQKHGLPTLRAASLPVLNTILDGPPRPDRPRSPTVQNPITYAAPAHAPGEDQQEPLSPPQGGSHCGTSGPLPLATPARLLRNLAGSVVIILRGRPPQTPRCGSSRPSVDR